MLDAGVQADQWLLRRLVQARRLGLPLLTASVAGAADPTPLFARLQLPMSNKGFSAATELVGMA